jgi:hypothetical protein
VGKKYEILDMSGWAKNVKFSTAPGVGKKCEIFDSLGWARKGKIFNRSGVAKQSEIFDRSGVVEVNILALFTDTEVINCFSTYHKKTKYFYNNLYSAPAIYSCKQNNIYTLSVIFVIFIH